jgi:Flp pilus assembly protein TadG
MMLRYLRGDESGGVFVEAAVLIPIMFLFLLGAVDFLYAFTQWTAATKAVQLGARLAAVSDPVAVGLNGIPNQVVSASVLVGDPMPDFQVTCTSGSCTCTRGSCPGVTGVVDAAAMNTIVYGRGSSACNDASSYYNAGMCDIFNRILPANVRIVYDQTGLGYAGRTSGPVPTIAVSLQNLTYQYFFLNGLRNFTNVAMPDFKTTVTGEVLSSAAAQ